MCEGGSHMCPPPPRLEVGVEEESSKPQVCGWGGGRGGLP